MQYAEAIAQLFRSPHADFVAERKRLAAEVKNGGDKDAAARLAKLSRPPISAWAVNQLWWQARAPFDEMLSTAKKVRAGDLGAMQEHRAALAKLRERATELLTAAGNAAADATIRRIQMTLSAIAASGGFEPDLPGALTEDRDPPGFAALGIPSAAELPAQKKPHLEAVPHEVERPGPKKPHLRAVPHGPRAVGEVEEQADAKMHEAEQKAEAKVAARSHAAEAKAAEKAKEAEEKAAARALDAELKAAEKAKQAEEWAAAEAEAAEARTRREEAQAEVERLRAATERLEDELSTARADLKAAERHLAKLK